MDKSKERKRNDITICTNDYVSEPNNFHKLTKNKKAHMRENLNKTKSNCNKMKNRKLCKAIKNKQTQNKMLHIETSVQEIMGELCLKRIN